MDVLRPIVVDGALAMTVGAFVDTLFSATSTGCCTPQLENVRDAAMSAGLVVGEAFVSIGLMARLSNWLYGTSGAELTDPTGGMLMLYVLFQSSPGWRAHVGRLTEGLQSYLRDKLSLNLAQSTTVKRTVAAPSHKYYYAGGTTGLDTAEQMRTEEGGEDDG